MTARFSAQENGAVKTWGVFDGTDGLYVPWLYVHDRNEAETLAEACNRLNAIGLAPSTRDVYDRRHDERMAQDEIARYEAGIRNARGQRRMILRGHAQRAIAAAAGNIPADMQLKNDSELATERRALTVELGADGTTALQAWEAACRLPCPDRETAERRSAIIRLLAAIDAEIGRRASCGTVEQPALFGAPL